MKLTQITLAVVAAVFAIGIMSSPVMAQASCKELGIPDCEDESPAEE